LHNLATSGFCGFPRVYHFNCIIFNWILFLKNALKAGTKIATETKRILNAQIEIQLGHGKEMCNFSGFV